MLEFKGKDINDVVGQLKQITAEVKSICSHLIPLAETGFTPRKPEDIYCLMKDADKMDEIIEKINHESKNLMFVNVYGPLDF